MLRSDLAASRTASESLDHLVSLTISTTIRDFYVNFGAFFFILKVDFSLVKILRLCGPITLKYDC